MATYDLGDVITLRCEVRDADGALADAGAVTCTITLPDGTTDTPTVDHEADSGIYTADYTPAAAGYFAVRWLATGVNAGAFVQDFTVRADAPLLTVDDLATHLHSSGFTAKDAPAAQAAVDYACAQVRMRLGFDLFDPARAVSGDDVINARGIALRTAAQWYGNPQDRATYSGPEGMSYTPSPQMLSRIMSEADRITLEMIQLRYAPGFG